VTFSGLIGGITYDFRAVSSVATWNEGTLTGYEGPTLSVKAGNTRPLNWAWTSSIVSGSAFGITATEWNAFTARINLFRTQYKAIASYAFTTAVSGDSLTATMFNQARTAINDMIPPTAVPSAVSSGGTCFASLFIGLRNSLNSIL